MDLKCKPKQLQDSQHQSRLAPKGTTPIIKTKIASDFLQNPRKSGLSNQKCRNCWTGKQMASTKLVLDAWDSRGWSKKRNNSTTQMSKMGKGKARNSQECPNLITQQIMGRERGIWGDLPPFHERIWEDFSSLFIFYKQTTPKMRPQFLQQNPRQEHLRSWKKKSSISSRKSHQSFLKVRKSLLRAKSLFFNHKASLVFHDSK